MDDKEKLQEATERINQMAEEIAELKATIDRLIEEVERKKKSPEQLAYKGAR
jgi:HAMP domain-containing protein